MNAQDRAKHDAIIARNAATQQRGDMDTSEDRCTDHGYATCPDCGNAGVKIGTDGYEACTRFLTCWADVDTYDGLSCERCGTYSASTCECDEQP